MEGLAFGSFVPPNLVGAVGSAPGPMTTPVVPFPLSGGWLPSKGTCHVPTSIPPVPEDDEELDVDDADDADEDEEGPPDEELTPMPPVAPMPPFPRPLPPSPPTFVPPDPFVVPDGSLRGPVAEQATVTNEEKTEAARRRLACFTRTGSAGLNEESSGVVPRRGACSRLVRLSRACFTGG